MSVFLVGKLLPRKEGGWVFLSLQLYEKQDSVQFYSQKIL